MFSLLYVDDEPGLLEIGKLFLETTGEFSVTTALSGEEALGQLALHDFDAVVSDYQMPEKDGLELLKSVRKSFGNIPFILFTGKGREEIVIEAINNGVDFYLQKGGDPRAQFAELAHKVRQAVGRRRAEIALSDSERRLADIINFLPDATFAIDTEGNVIAWNRAIEEMTGIRAADMLGRGDYEYALPFYGTRRPILVDLIFESDDRIAQFYSNILRDGNMLSAETNLPHPKGQQIHVLAKASPLYNKEGEITGAIEAIRDITDRKKAEEELLLANEQLAASGEELRAQYDELTATQIELSSRKQQLEEVATTVPGVVYQIAIRSDSSTVLRFVNVPAAERIFGYDHTDDDLFRWMNAHIYPDDRKRFTESIEEVIRKRTDWNFEGRLIQPSGKTIWFQGISSLVIYGSDLIYTGVLLDITRRSEEQEELLEKSEELDRFFTMSLDLLCIADTNGYFVRLNPAWEEVLGYSSADLEGRRFLDFVHPDDLPATLAAVSDLSGQKEVLDFTNRYRCKDGSWRWIEWRSRPKGNLIYAAARDITDKKRIGDALDLLLRQDREALGVARMGHFEFDVETRTFVFNDQYYELIGTTAGEMGGYRVSEEEFAERFATPENNGLVHDTIRQAIETDDPDFQLRFEVPFIRPDRARIWMSIWFRIEKDAAGKTTRFYGVNQDITERKAAETALRESEERYRILTDFAFDGVLIQDFSGKILYINPSIQRMMGIPDPGMFAGKTILDFIDPESRESVIRDLQNVLTGKGGYLQSYKVRALEGRDLWVESIGTKIRYRGQDANIVALRDITDRKRMEEKLRESEEKYRLISENSPDMIYFIDPEGYIRYINAPAAKAMKAEPGNVMGKCLTELFRPDVARLHLEAVHRVMATRTPVRSEMFEELPSGGIWLDIRLSPLVDESGRVLGVLGLSHDISDRKQAEAALRESETKYRMLVENSHDIIYTIRADGIMTFVSPSWTTLLGHDPAYVTGKPFQHFVHPADVPECEAFLAKVVSTRERQSGIEYRVIHADGSIRIYTTTISPILDDKGSIVSYIGNARDITETKQFQNAIRESNRKLNLLSSITRHDVANQLTVVQGYTQLAALRKTDPVTADFLAKIASAVDMIQHQIEFTRTYQDLGAQAPAWHRVGDTIRSVQPRGIELVCTCDSMEIFADPMIAKVFYNLFDNAVKYGERVTTITVGCEPAGDELVITFADNGIGIALDEKQKIFKKGYGQHTGFGLFLAREILAITGISIHETGSCGKGARFEIAVPKGAYRSA